MHSAGRARDGGSDVRIGVASFRVSEGHTVTLVQADPYIEIADEVLEHADPNFVSQGDGIVTFHCTGGDVTYGLHNHDDIRDTWLGVRADVADVGEDDP